ncbi:MAG: fructosamine kinase family protein [Lachnospiraceae bacterium]|nr:fructosamine kinase family protein [Lachnospiraceae bacterium]
MGLVSYESLEAAVRGCFGARVEICRSSHAPHGDINSTKILHLTNGESVFLKTNTVGNRGFFDAEEEGLIAIMDTGTAATPKLFAKGVDWGGGFSFLMMEVIERGDVTGKSIAALGYDLAGLHLADAGKYVEDGKYGFLHDNYIGATKQINTPKDSWIDFFRECRLKPQFKMAENAFTVSDRKRIIRLMDRLADLLTEPEKPSLLHGDLWGGNHLFDREGNAVLIDPAAYVGHAEADLAMTEMFRPFPQEFYEAYFARNPLVPGYRERKKLYNLYHELNHFNLFGGGYLRSALDTVMYFTAD